MKVNELRIGNLVRIDRGIGKVVSINSLQYNIHDTGEGYPIVVEVSGQYLDCTEEEVEGILITPEYLYSVGFIEETIDEWVRFRKGKFCLEEDGERISYVHELQNLYYAIYKQELEEL